MVEISRLAISGAAKAKRAAFGKTRIGLIMPDRDQAHNFRHIDAGNDAKLRQVRTQRVDRLSLLTNQKAVCLQHHPLPPAVRPTSPERSASSCASLPC
jgi:hypothetical protein